MWVNCDSIYELIAGLVDIEFCVAENGREVHIEEEFPEVKVDFQVKYLINPYFKIWSF